MDHAFIGELVGTMFLILFGGGVVAGVLLKHSKAENSGWIVITAGWGFAVMIGVYMAQAGGSAQADINPIVSIAKYFFGIYSNIGHVIMLIIAQIVGAIIGGVLVWLSYLPHWKATDNQRFKLLVFSTSPEIKSPFSNLLCEVIASFSLIVFVAALLKYYNHQWVTVDIPYVFGFAVWAIGLSLGGPTGYAINPARDFGPRIAHSILPIANKGSSEWSYAWVPIIGPVIGCFFGILFAKLLFI
ncbi:MAG: aquaporin family protein [Gammaproteobacteria bacterium]|nr:MAG: aquaporin family protein [Gammaproteobacteria bacterium]UTW42009.1 aquaporin family protein [bacterium SCSIO 12844]